MKTDKAATLSMPWRTVAIVSLVANGAVLAALATTAGVQGADALSTVALSLAVVAFIAQLMIFAWQTFQNAAQLVQAQTLNRSTLELIADAKTRIDGTYDMVREHHAELLRLKAGAELLKQPSFAQTPNATDSGAVASLANPLASSVRQYEIDSLPLTGATSEASLRVTGTSSQIEGLRRQFSWPTDAAELAETLDRLDELSDHEQRLFGINVSDYVLSLANGSVPGLGMVEGDENLIARGWLEETTPRDGERQVTLTSEGTRYALPFVGLWPPPKHIAGLAARIWEKRKLVQDKYTELMDRNLWSD